jgi:hypothetical protein
MGYARRPAFRYVAVCRKRYTGKPMGVAPPGLAANGCDRDMAVAPPHPAGPRRTHIEGALPAIHHCLGGCSFCGAPCDTTWFFDLLRDSPL